MVLVKVSVHPQGLGPREAAKAWYSSLLHKEGIVLNSCVSLQQQLEFNDEIHST